MSASAIRFVGNFDVTAEGKFLWELLAQMRRFGVGRVVTKNEWLRQWPDQPSFIKITRVQPAMDRWLFGGKMWGEWTYRGKNLGVFEFAHDLNRSDWRVVHKHEEASLAKCARPIGEMSLPDSFPLPPLQVHMAKKAAVRAGGSPLDVSTRAPLSLCIDPQFNMVKHLFKQAPPKQRGVSVYDEADPAAFLDLYGKELPTKVEAWNVGPATFTPRFSATEMRVQEQSSQ